MCVYCAPRHTQVGTEHLDITKEGECARVSVHGLLRSAMLVLWINSILCMHVFIVHSSLFFVLHSISHWFSMFFSDGKSPAPTFMLIIKVNWLTLATPYTSLICICLNVQLNEHILASIDANQCKSVIDNWGSTKFRCTQYFVQIRFVSLHTPLKSPQKIFSLLISSSSRCIQKHDIRII